MFCCHGNKRFKTTRVNFKRTWCRIQQLLIKVVWTTNKNPSRQSTNQSINQSINKFLQGVPGSDGGGVLAQVPDPPDVGGPRDDGGPARVYLLWHRRPWPRLRPGDGDAGDRGTDQYSGAGDRSGLQGSECHRRRPRGGILLKSVNEKKYLLFFVLIFTHELHTSLSILQVSPPYDMNGTTALTGANLLFEMLCVLPGVKYSWFMTSCIMMRPDIKWWYCRYMYL